MSQGARLRILSAIRARAPNPRIGVRDDVVDNLAQLAVATEHLGKILNILEGKSSEKW